MDSKENALPAPRLTGDKSAGEGLWGSVNQLVDVVLENTLGAGFF